MIMPAGRPLLLAANPRFIAASLCLALLAHMLLGLLGWAGMPDVLAVVLAFWAIHQPQRVGMAWAFVFGLLVDVHESALLGQNALSYVCMAFMALSIHRRVKRFPVWEQTLQVLPLFFAVAVLEWLVRLLTHGAWPTATQWLAPFLQTALWPLLGHALLAPQRMAPERSSIRPL